jgi:hypothetical protein
MSDDGGTIVFSTDEALSSADTNGGHDVYMWHDGRVSLISSGGRSFDDIFTAGYLSASISPSGRDVYFGTTARLTANDVDTQLDVYDARVDGGFDLATPPPCSGDGCQSPPSAPPPPSNPGSTSSAGHDGLPQTTPAFTVGKLTASQLKRVASTGKVSLSVTTNAPGTLAAKATATLARRPSTVGSAKRKAPRAGTLSLTLTLSEKARSELKHKCTLTVKVLVSQDNVAITRTVSLKLTQPKAKKKSSRTTSRHAAAKEGRS